MPSNPPKGSELRGDLLFLVLYVPQTLPKILIYACLGALLGFISSFVLRDTLERFARDNHDAVDLTGTHLPEDQKFIHLSRSSIFNKKVATINEILPFYATLVGSTSATFFQLVRLPGDFQKKLEADRELRILKSIV
ncbi:MAG: hypothetical protein P4L65_10920 [Legionella sp.]|nr:hypothetical protein [Legionella sp.]